MGGLTLGVIGSVLVAGCSLPANERLTIGSEQSRSFLDVTDDTNQLGMQSESAIERKHWPVTTVTVPIDGVLHGATFRREQPIGRRADRWEVNAFPLLGEPRKTGGDRWFDAGRAIGRSLGDVTLFPLRATLGGGSVGWSPRLIWKRTSSDRARMGTVGSRRNLDDPGE
ncbi:MAG: hypothetical protein AB8F26_07600 [Phycisphaerales bacterium]